MRRTSISSAVLLLFACGGSVEEPEQDTIRRVRSEPMPQSFVRQNLLATTGAASAVGVDFDGNTVVVVGGTVQRYRAGQFESFLLYADEGEPTSLGAVHAIAPRQTGGAWIAADNGLFVLDSAYVQFAGVAGPVRGVAEASVGPLAGLWLLTSNGLEHQRNDERNSYTIEGVDDAPEHFAISPSGNLAGVVFGGRPYIIAKDDAGIYFDPTAESIPTAADVVVTNKGVWVATNDGVYSYALSDDMWTQYTLTAQGSRAALMLAMDPLTETVWARTDNTLVSIDGDNLNAYTTTAAVERTLFVDNPGDLVGHSGGTGIVIRSLNDGGDNPTFTNDILPWLEENCLRCRGNQTADYGDYNVFVTRANQALLRVRTGDMPRCDGGVRCDEGQALNPQNYAVLDQWIRSGLTE